MEKLKLNVFDMFGHVIPGSILLFAIILPFDEDIKSIKSLFSIVNNLKTGFITLYVFLSFLMSMTFHRTALEIFKSINRKFSFKKYKVDLDEEELSEINVLIRKNEPENFEFLQEWISKRAMSFNLSFSFFILMIICLFKIKYDSYWILICLMSLLATFVFMGRAIMFNNWFNQDLYNTLKMIDSNTGRRNSHWKFSNETVINKPKIFRYFSLKEVEKVDHDKFGI